MFKISFTQWISKQKVSYKCLNLRKRLKNATNVVKYAICETIAWYNLKNVCKISVKAIQNHSQNQIKCWKKKQKCCKLSKIDGRTFCKVCKYL